MNIKDEIDSKFIADTGTVFVRQDGNELFLGLSVERDPDKDPDVRIQLTKRQGRSLMEELTFWLAGGTAETLEEPKKKYEKPTLRTLSEEEKSALREKHPGLLEKLEK
jgi:hypothetical protein